MRSVSELIDEYISTEKESAYERIIGIQERFLKDAVKEGRVHGTMPFVAGDMGFYHGIEKEWFDEFFERAKAECEAAGYIVTASGNYLKF